MASEADERDSLTSLLQGTCGDRAPLLADILIGRFASTGGVLSASKEALQAAIPGDGAVVHQLHLVRDTLEQVLRVRLDDRAVLSDERGLIEYLTFSMAHAATERLRVLFLDAGNHLIRDEVVSTGCVRGAAVHPREIMRRAIELGATALILVHNHPSGDPAPSLADVETTKRVAAAAEIMGLRLHDHLIVARSGYASLRRLGHLSL